MVECRSRTTFTGRVLRSAKVPNVRSAALVWSVALFLAATAASAGAHFAPSLDANNRYLKLTPMGDRVRLAYTVYMGEQPGAAARLRLDTDHDGMISDVEADVFGKDVAAQVAGALEVTADGHSRPITWQQRYVGLGTPATRGGAFSVDLVAWICLGPGPKHRLQLFDRFRIPQPGETEVRIEESPGIRVTQSTLGPDGEQNMLDMKWMGGAGPAATDGIYLEFTADSDAVAMSAGDDCPGDATPTADRGGPAAATSPRKQQRRRPYVIVAGLAALVLVGAALVFSARRRRG